jgi:iron complex transport system substrate-binding protein
MNAPLKIVSLLPSATEIVAELGLLDNLVGVSHCCDWPPGVEDLPVVTSSVVDKTASSHLIDQVVRDHLFQSSALYSLDRDLLENLKPDLVITQALCDVCAVSGEEVGDVLSKLSHCPEMINFEPYCLGDVLDTMMALGDAVGCPERAESKVKDLNHRIQAVSDLTRHKVKEPRRVALIDWVAPPFVSGHWMEDLIQLSGGESVLEISGKPSRTISWEELIEAKPEVLVIACCGFSAGRTRKELELCDPEGLRNLKKSGTKVEIVDGDALFSRPGPRLVDSLELLAHLLHPSVHEPRVWFDRFR